MRLRALLLCDDVRFELGGTMTLVGVYADRIVVGSGVGPGGSSELIHLPRLAIYSVVAGLTEANELTWRQTLVVEGEGPGAPVAEGREPHDPTSDEHRLVNILSPFTLPGSGRYRLIVELETLRDRRSIEHRFTVERDASW
jgi:hypothetical protein